jgi:hypothetical protein
VVFALSRPHVPAVAEQMYQLEHGVRPRIASDATSQQIRRAADRLLPTVLRDSDGLDDERRGIISVFAGPPPEVRTLSTIAAEAETVREVVATWLGEGIAAHEIGLFVRTQQLVVRARAAIDGLAGAAEMVTVQMSLAKGLEFRAVVVMACGEGVLPLDERVADAADEAELDDIYETASLGELT